MNALARIVVAVLLLAVAAPAAQAAFPGKNGAIGFAHRSTSGDTEPAVERIGLEAKTLGPKARRLLVECVLSDGVPSAGDCTGRDYRSPSYSAKWPRTFDSMCRATNPIRPNPIIPPRSCPPFMTCPASPRHLLRPLQMRRMPGVLDDRGSGVRGDLGDPLRG